MSVVARIGQVTPKAHIRSNREMVPVRLNMRGNRRT